MTTAKNPMMIINLEMFIGLLGYSYVRSEIRFWRVFRIQSGSSVDLTSEVVHMLLLVIIGGRQPSAIICFISERFVISSLLLCQDPAAGAVVPRTAPVPAS